MESTTQGEKKQILTLSSRRHITIDGVVDVKSFDDALVCLETNMGKLNIEGKQLRITKYLLQSGEMSVEGIIDAIIYSDPEEGKRGLLSKLGR